MISSPDARGPHRIALLGVGLIGGSIGMALRANNAAESVVGWDADDLINAVAIERGAVDRMALSAEEAVADADLVILAPPTESIIPLLALMAPALPESAVVTDVGSAKARIVARAEMLIGGRFIGGHPMAGLEESGIGSASPSLFHNAAWILTPTERTSEMAVARARRLVTAVNARPRECDPETHDRIAALISHLPHLLAYGLADSAGSSVSGEFVDLVAGSFRDGSRVALSDPIRWTEILIENREAAVDALDTFIAWGLQTREALRSGDRDSLGLLLGEAHRHRKRFPR